MDTNVSETRKVESVSISLTDAGEIRRLGRILLGAVAMGGQTGAFAAEAASRLGFNADNTRKL